MLPEEEIKKRLDSLKADERNYYKLASVFSNAPLALIQQGLSNQINALELVLELPLSTFPLKKE
jgi:hypothetical protein